MRTDLIQFKRQMAASGITDTNFINGLFSQLINADRVGGDNQGLEFAVSVIDGIKPKDQLEAMLAAQMAVMHMSTMRCLPQLGKSGTGSQLHESAERTVTKQIRTFIAGMDALKRYRTGGEQKVTVQHVSVADGGQAIVGSVTQNALEKPADESMAIAARPQVPTSNWDPESLEDEAQTWRDFVAEKKKAALVDSSQPEVPLPDKSQSKPTPPWRRGKVRRGRSSSATVTASYRPPPPRPRD